MRGASTRNLLLFSSEEKTSLASMGSCLTMPCPRICGQDHKSTPRHKVASRIPAVITRIANAELPGLGPELPGLGPLKIRVWPQCHVQTGGAEGVAETSPSYLLCSFLWPKSLANLLRRLKRSSSLDCYTTHHSGPSTKLATNSRESASCDLVPSDVSMLFLASSPTELAGLGSM